MVFSSSCTVYGEPEKVPIDETFPRKACSPYGNTKLVIEDIMTGTVRPDSINMYSICGPGTHETASLLSQPSLL